MSSVKHDIEKFFPRNDDDDDDDTGVGSLRSWKGIVENISFESIPAYALSIRKRRAAVALLSDTDVSVELNTKPTVVEPALLGSFHAAFVIEFTDGIKWLLKIPATGHSGQFTSIEARALTSEALTMRLLKDRTDIAVPEVYSFSESLDNELNCPFILMEYIDGTPLHACWFDRNVSAEILEQHRATSLKEIAAAMIQLDKFKFSYAGAPLFDEYGDLVGVGPAKKYDIHAEWNKRSPDVTFDESTIYCEKGPYINPETYMLCMLDNQKPSSLPIEGDAFGLGVNLLLRLFISWIPKPQESEKPEFVLTHPDFDIQNIIVSPEGHLLSFIDWDGVAAVPYYLGNERLPSWLTRDWDPCAYTYRQDVEPNEEINEPANAFENSPEELKRYRAMYADFIAAHEDPTDQGANSSSSSITQNSLITENLKIAADDHMHRFHIVEKIYNEIVSVQTGGKITNNEDIPREDAQKRFYELTLALAEGEREFEALDWVKDGFLALFGEEDWDDWKSCESW